MSALDALDCEIGNIPSNATDVFGNIAMNGDEYVRCVRCSYGGCDLRVAGCGCTLHSVGDCVFLYESFVLVLRGFLVTAPFCRATPRLLHHLSCRFLEWTGDEIVKSMQHLIHRGELACSRATRSCKR